MNSNAEAALREAATEFCRRVEAGEIRSKRSYAAFKAALSAPAADGEAEVWRTMESAPRDATVQVVVEPTAENLCLDRTPRVHPAYIDDEGRICDAGSWKPDSGFTNRHWQTTHWRPLASFPDPIQEKSRGQEISDLREKLSDALAGGIQHSSDCAVYLAPSYTPKPCDCGATRPAPGSDAVLREALDDFLSHYANWKKAIDIAQNSALVILPDIDDKSYWQHQADVLDRVYKALSASGSPGDVGRERFYEALAADKIKGWPSLKVAIWRVVTGENMNDGHYINAYDLTDKLYAAASAPSDPAAPQGQDAADEIAKHLSVWLGALRAGANRDMTINEIERANGECVTVAIEKAIAILRTRAPEAVHQYQSLDDGWHDCTIEDAKRLKHEYVVRVLYAAPPAKPVSVETIARVMVETNDDLANAHKLHNLIFGDGDGR